MLLTINGADVTALVASVSTSGSSKECARTLKANIVQSPIDHNVPIVSMSVGDTVTFYEDGQRFVGTVRQVQRSTASQTVVVTAKDFGVYVVNNQISAKVKNATPAEAAAVLAGQYGVPVGRLEDVPFTFSRKWVGVSLYDAMMTGYALAAAENGNVYRMWIDGTSVNIGQMGSEIACMLSETENILQAVYTEDIEKMISQVDIVDNDGNITQSITGDTSYGITRQQIQASKGEDAIAKAQEILQSKGLVRKGTVKNLGDAACISGRAILVQETYAGLYGLFYITADTHSWQNGIYTNSLTLSYEEEMTAKAAGEEFKERKAKSPSNTPTTQGSVDAGIFDDFNKKYGG